MRPSIQKFVLRLPNDLHSQIKRTAKAESHSMNQEIINQLKRALAKDDGPDPNEQLLAQLLQKLATMEQQLESLLVKKPKPKA
ncbi:Arc family DNA-binding protein [Pseudomonas sp. LD120]|uniref:Arc family DNA-binding protein n=1 Tax=Pseudomonas sp. LD120 TaxID=485751 RepID=UPI001357BBA7|nr:Arc family DNA-binding protein [Pseudomonas sp. LD120]KAF0865837.1 Arc family DNA-binding protein [Pseudomonas sp. LD120]